MARTITKSGNIGSGHTTIAHADGLTTCTLYGTIIAVHDHKSQTVKLNTGGYNTPTTFRRMNQCLYVWGFIGNARRFVGKADFVWPGAQRRVMTMQGLLPL